MTPGCESERSIGKPVKSGIVALDYWGRFAVATAAFVFVLVPTALFAHHGGEGAISTGAVDPFTGKSVEPTSYAMVLVDDARGAKYNRSIYTSTLFLESSFNDGLFALNVSVPYLYYDQKDREDAGRFGRVYIGGKLFPFRGHTGPFFFVLDSRIGFPTGSDTDRFIPGDYWDAAAGLTSGLSISRFSFGFRWGGQQPLTRLRPRKDPQPESITDPTWMTYSSQNTTDTEQLRKVTELSGFASVRIGHHLSVFTGYYMRTPFNGILWEDPGKPKNYLVEPFDPVQYYLDKKTNTNPPLPRYYREASAGLSVNFTDRYAATVSYRYPLERDQNMRPYESVVSASFSVKFGGFHYHGYESKESEEHRHDEGGDPHQGDKEDLHHDGTGDLHDGPATQKAGREP